MGIKEIMISVLRDRNTQRISFSFQGTTGMRIEVTGLSFERVAQAISEDRISIVEGGAFPGAARYSASWDPVGLTNANTFYIGENNYRSALFHALIVHESVHASFDLNRCVLPWIDNEAAAYIAQGFYLRYARTNVSGLRRVGTGNEAYLAYELAGAVAGGERTNNFWMDQLRDSIDADPLYHAKARDLFRGDG